MGGSVSPLMMASPLPQMPAGTIQAPVSAERLRQAVLQFPDRAPLDALTQLSVPVEPTLTAMQTLITLLQTLRSPDQGWQAHQPPTPDALLPYVSDEAYDVLERLSLPGQNQLKTPTVSQPALVHLETLSPKLLWAVARSSYTTMQLLEGLPARICAPDGEWQVGIVRLAVIVELGQAESYCAIDLALGDSPDSPIPANWLIQLDQDSDFQAEEERTGGDGSEKSLFWLKRSLSSITRQLVLTQPCLQSWLEGIPVEWLVAGADWRSGEIRLKLDMSFLPQLPEPFGSPTTRVDSIEAELLDEPDTAAPGNSDRLGSSGGTTSLPITVVEMPSSPTISTTLIRLATPELQTQFAQFAFRQDIVQCLQAFANQARTHAAEQLLLPFVQASYRLAIAPPSDSGNTFCLRQPELFMDELLPKLLWHVTRSSFTVMEWLAGVTCHLLQPATQWQSGLLRLIVVLDLQTQDNQWWMDLATGRLLPAQEWQVDGGAIARLHPDHPELIAIDQLNAQFHQLMRDAAPEIAILRDGIEIDWLTREHDWQPGRLQLHLGFEFLPDLF